MCNNNRLAAPRRQHQHLEFQRDPCQFRAFQQWTWPKSSLKRRPEKLCELEIPFHHKSRWRLWGHLSTQKSEIHKQLSWMSCLMWKNRSIDWAFSFNQWAILWHKFDFFPTTSIFFIHFSSPGHNFFKGGGCLGAVGPKKIIFFRTNFPEWYNYSGDSFFRSGKSGQNPDIGHPRYT